MDEMLILILCVVFVMLAAPAVAIAVATAALRRARRLEDELHRLRMQLDMLLGRSAEADWRAGVPPPAPRPSRPSEAVGPPADWVEAPARGALVPDLPARPERQPEPERPAVPEPLAAPITPAEPAADAFISVGRPAAAASLEEKLGARLFVWIGALALALAGALLVKYSFDKNLLTPRVRVIVGVMFGAALLGAGEWMRPRSERIGQGLSAAGIADLFACLLAAVNLYDLIRPTLGFALMAGTTALAVALSLRQGSFVALLGLVGGFLTPVLIRTGDPRPSLFAYLFLLEAGLLAVTRRRNWYLLTGLTLLGGMGWAAVWLSLFYQPEHGLWLGLFLLGSVGAFTVASQSGRPEEVWGHPAVAHALNWSSTALGLVLVGVLVHVSEYSPLEWAFLGLLGAGCLAVARLRTPQEGLAWLAAVASAGLLCAWAVGADDLDQDRFGRTALLFGVLYAAGAYACLWGSDRPGHWASLSVAAGIAFFLVAYYFLDRQPFWMEARPSGLERRPFGLPWGVTSLILAAVYAFATAPVAMRRARGLEWEEALAAMAVGVTSLVSLAVPMELERAWISVAWAIEIPLLGAIHLRSRLAALRVLAGVLAVLVVVRLVVNPSVLDYPIGDGLLENWLWYGYGLPALALAVGAWLFRRASDDELVDGLGAGAILLGLALITLEARQHFHPGWPWSTQSSLNEMATLVVLWIVYGWTLLLGTRRWPRPAILWGGRVIASVGVITSVVLCGLVQNPLWTHDAVGASPVFNLLLLIYGVPAALALLVALEFKRQGERPSARLVGAASLLLFFLLVTLEVRHGFHGTFLNVGERTPAELYAYSVAWGLFGVVLLVLGITAGGAVLRYGSLAVMMLTAGKVFLFDTAHLEDLYRVFSFFGLGVSLLVLAYLYQRFVFTRSAMDGG